MAPLASSHADLHATIAVLVVGAVVGVAGHIVRARWLVLLGIAIVGAAFVVFFLSAASDRGSAPPRPLPRIGSG